MLLRISLRRSLHGPSHQPSLSASPPHVVAVVVPIAGRGRVIGGRVTPRTSASGTWTRETGRISAAGFLASTNATSIVALLLSIGWRFPAAVRERSASPRL